MPSWTGAPLKLVCVASAPPLKAHDERLGVLFEAVNSILGGNSLKILITEDHRRISIKDKATLVTYQSNKETIPLLWNGEDDEFAFLNARMIPSPICPGNASLSEFVMNISKTSLSCEFASKLLVEIGESTEAYWAIITPENAAEIIGSQTIHSHIGGIPLRGLPALHPSSELDSCLVPQRLGWINYWSKEAFQRILLSTEAHIPVTGFRIKDTRLGWIIHTTIDPLDLDLPDHLEALQAMYQIYPAIGGRLTSVVR